MAKSPITKSLIIVESPAKTKTLKGFLGNNYAVEASMGHVRDLPSSRLGVDVEKDFEPTYIALKDRKDVLAKLTAAAKGVTTVYLASDPDREGEAIAWHIANALKLKPEQIQRIQFNEITKSAVQDALANPRQINMRKVDAQQARRVLDRLVGYEISPILWAKVQKNLSAGRVQSVAVRLVCDREREIQAFVPVEYWSLTATLTPQPKRQPFDAALVGFEGKKLELHNKMESDKVLSDLENALYRVAKLKKSERQRKPSAPFITSTLQQEASRKLGYSSKRTMNIAQQLYEGIDLGGDYGQVGLITYMRTDSTRVAAEAQAEAYAFITENYGERYAPPTPNIYKSKNATQDAHEAIRPTSVLRVPDAIKAKLTNDQYKLYRLIWLRFVASQMKPAIMDVVTVDIASAPNLNSVLVGDALLNQPGVYGFRATGSTIKFDGFLRVYSEGKDDATVDDDERPPLPPLTEAEILDLIKLTPKQHFTEPPPRYSEATLVKALEEQGIGRPSTYASIISTIQDRKYTELIEKRFHPTELGFTVTDLLVKHFPDILSVRFTAGMEDRLDKVEEGEQDWVELMREFYGPFKLTLQAAEEQIIPQEDRICPDCGKPLQERFGRFGRFTTCSGYPECKYIHKEAKAAPVESDIPCPNCGKMLVERRGRFGTFLGCPGYPDCKYIHKEAPKSTGVQCPECKQGELVEKKSKKGVFYACNRYPECRCSAPTKPLEKPCPACGGLLVERMNKGEAVGARCVNKACGFTEDFPNTENESE